MIKRRVMLVGLAAAAATPAFAQVARGPASSSAEMQHIMQTMAIGSLSLAVSRIAETKAQFAQLKEFAQFEVAEQETVADVLKSLMNPGTASGIVKAPTEAEVEEHLDAQAKQILAKMRAAPAGAEFDREYHDAQNDGHQKLLRIQQDYLMSGRNLDSINVAKLASGMIKEHLKLLADIGSGMGATTGTAPRR